MKKTLQFLLVFTILICIYFLTLFFVSCIPSDTMKENVKSSADYFINNGGEKSFINLGYKDVCLFNFTNALMLNTAYSIDSDNPIEAFLTAKKNFIPGVTQTIHTDTSKDLMSASKYYENGIFDGNAFQTLELYDTVNKNDLYEAFEYQRYWHGYLVFLRPLLVLFDYEEIIIISQIIFTGLLITCSILIYKKIGIFQAIALILAYVSVDLFIVTKSINEIICFDLALIFSIFLLLKKDKSNIPLNFFIFGSLTNFLDFFTNPIVTYGIPIIIYFMLILKDTKINFKDMFFIYLKTSIAWFVGYLATWLSKWLITDIILNRGVIKNAIDQVVFRSSINPNAQNIDFGSFFTKLKLYFSEGTIVFICIFCISIVLFNLKNIRNINSKDYKNNSMNILTYFVSALIPFVWYLVLSQHSYVHMFFTYRNLAIAVFALELLVLELVKPGYNKIKDEEFKVIDEK